MSRGSLVIVAALAAFFGVSHAQAQAPLCRFAWNAGTMVLNANGTGVWTGGPDAAEFANQRGENRWRVEGDTIIIDWTIVSAGHMRGRQGTTRPPLSRCPAARR
jgi:hypothetical protein